jgi:thaumarchaeosortase
LQRADVAAKPQTNNSITATRLFLIALATPLIGIAVLDYSSLLTAWNQGRGGFVFAMLFLALELADSRRWLPSNVSKVRMIGSVTASLLTLSYFIATRNLGLHSIIENNGKALGVPLVFSWVWLWDYLVFFAFLLFLVPAVFGVRTLRMLPSANVYLLGMAMILSLDSFFPFDALGPLQAVVPIILQTNAFIIRALDLGSVTVSGNTMILDGNHGVFSISVFWPSAGIHSIIIYSLIMLLFLIKIKSTGRRRAVYFVIGALGTFMVNIIRIFVLSSYVLLVTVDRVRFEEFHAIAGEILFLPWLLVFLFLVSSYESGISAKQLSMKGAV